MLIRFIFFSLFGAFVSLFYAPNKLKEKILLRSTQQNIEQSSVSYMIIRRYSLFFVFLMIPSMYVLVFNIEKKRMTIHSGKISFRINHER
jgi:hypothetical protein